MSTPPTARLGVLAADGKRPRLLDLFCGAGGASMGYYRAGFDVVGVDLAPQPHYPFEFIQADALTYPLDGFDAVAASPVCKGYTQANHIQQREYPLLIAPVRERLRRSGLPWVLENVRMTGKWRGHMPSAIELCGAQFGLHVYRHRYFEASHLLFAPGPCTHPNHLLPGYLCVYGHQARGRQTGNKGNKYIRATAAAARAAMGIDWMTLAELSQAIPPAYTEWLGRQLLRVVSAERTAVA